MVKNFKTLFLADPHMSNKLPYAKPTKDGLTDRFEDQLELWSQIHACVEKDKVDAVVILGDLFDKSIVDAVTLTYTVDEISKTPCDVFILPGNHDANNTNGRFIVEAFGRMQNEHIKVIGDKDYSTIQVGLDDEILEFWPMSFKSVEKTFNELKEINSKIDRKKHNFLLLHNSIIGANHLGWKSKEGLSPRFVCQDFERVYAGHFHKTQTFGPKENGIYIGSPMHHDFGDVGHIAGFLVVDFCKTEKGFEIKEEFKKTDLPNFYVAKSLEEKTKAKKGDYLRFELKATKAQWARLMASKARKVCSLLEENEGIHASFVHVVESHHKSRIGEGKIEGSIKLEEAIEDYVNSVDVVTKGLNLKKLKKIGCDYLELIKELT